MTTTWNLVHPVCPVHNTPSSLALESIASPKFQKLRQSPLSYDDLQQPRHDFPFPLSEYGFSYPPDTNPITRGFPPTLHKVLKIIFSLGGDRNLFQISPYFPLILPGLRRNTSPCNPAPPHTITIPSRTLHRRCAHDHTTLPPSLRYARSGSDTKPLSFLMKVPSQHTIPTTYCGHTSRLNGHQNECDATRLYSIFRNNP